MGDTSYELTVGSNEFSSADWRSIGATIDYDDRLPGPYTRPLIWLGNNQNGFAKLEGRQSSRVEPGERISFGLVIARPTALVSALCLDSEAGRPELRIQWSCWPPRRWLLGTAAGFCAVRGEVVAVNNETYAIMLVAENATRNAVDVTPAFNVAHGIQNVGLDVGMYAGVADIDPLPQ